LKTSCFLKDFILIFLLILSLPYINSCSDEANSQEDIQRIFISTDIASGLVGGWRSGPADNDDGFAVELISSFSDTEIEGVAVLRGNDLQPAELFAADQIFVQNPGIWNGPIITGAIEFLPTPDPVMWTGGIDDDVTLTDICVNDAVVSLSNLLSESSQPITILALGPLTDIACLVLNFPDKLSNIKEIVFLAGRLPDEVLKYSFSDIIFTDFNFAQDVRATQVVLNDSNIPITFISFSLSSSTTYTREQIDSLQDEECSDRAKTLSRSAQAGMDVFQSDFNLDGLDTFDINAAYYIAKPELFTCEDAGFEFVECEIGTPGVPNGINNSCASHGPNQSSGLNSEFEQLWVGPTLLGQSRTVRTCTSYVNQQELERFESGTIDVICAGTEWTDLPL